MYKRQDHAWKIAIIAGAIASIIVIAVGDIALGVHTSYGALIGGSIAAVGIGLVLELFFFTVDYARSENLQFEDDEYYYYVKAIPKVSISTPEKTVKRINERQETEIINTEEVRRKSGKGQGRNAAAPVSYTHLISDLHRQAISCEYIIRSYEYQGQ